MQAQLTTLEEEKQALSANNSQKHAQLQAANAQHKVLSSSLQEVNSALEQKCKDEAVKGEKQLAELKVPECFVFSRNVTLSTACSDALAMS